MSIGLESRVRAIVDVLNKRQNKRQDVERVSIYNSIYKSIYCVSRLFGLWGFLGFRDWGMRYSGCFE